MAIRSAVIFSSFIYIFFFDRVLCHEAKPVNSLCWWHQLLTFLLLFCSVLRSKPPTATDGLVIGIILVLELGRPWQQRCESAALRSIQSTRITEKVSLCFQCLWSLMTLIKARWSYCTETCTPAYWRSKVQQLLMCVTRNDFTEIKMGRNAFLFSCCHIHHFFSLRYITLWTVTTNEALK